MRSNYLFTSESVSEGHPDKVADQISDAIVDLFLSKDPEARIACETLTTTQLVVLAGEIRCKGVYENGQWAEGAQAEIEATVRRTVKEIGYAQDGFHWQTFRFENNLHGQSAEIAQGVDAGDNKDEGAGDQGIMFGYATDETPDLMPATLYYSHKILERMAADRHSGADPFLEPDAKSQVTLRYEESLPVAATAIVVSTQHTQGYCLTGDHADPAMADAYRTRSPVWFAHRITTPLLVFHGDDDPVVPVGQSRLLVERMKASGADVELCVYPGEGHGFRQRHHQLDEYARTEAFLSRHVR
jgi:S-adenosylmethionine synthetase